MPKIKLTSNNRRKSTLITLLIIAFGVVTILFPLLLLRLIPQSVIGNYVLEHLYYAYISIPILLYVFYTGIYFYKIKIDSYIIDIRSYRTISGIFQPPNYIDIAHPMLSEFAFFTRPFSFNKTLMIKLKTTAKKKVVKRFHLTFLSKKEEKKISKKLEQIIANERK